MALPKCTFPSAVSQRGNALLNIRLPYRSNSSIRSRPLAVQRRLRRRGMCRAQHGVAQPLRGNLFRVPSTSASRYRSVAERVMDVGPSFLRWNVRNTRRAVKVEYLECRTLYALSLARSPALLDPSSQ
jgi:hypothetical protein